MARAHHRTIAPLLLGAVLLAGIGNDASSQEPPPDPAFLAVDTVPTFRHGEHDDLTCGSCHRMDAMHGGSFVRTVEDCRSCHHTERSGMECADCHTAGALQGRLFALERSVRLSVHDAPTTRSLPFRHQAHDELDCASCHDDGPSLGVPELDCQSCHEEHHEATTSCLDCHVEPTEDAHDLNVHASCSASGCHQEVPVESPPRTRGGCLWCHQDMNDHEAGRSCVMCHFMPPPPTEAREGPGGGGR